MKKVTLGIAALLPAGVLFGQATDVRVQMDQLKAQIEHLAPQAAAGSSFEFVSSAMVSGRSVKGAPYSAEAVNESTQTLADGNRIVRRNSTRLYRDSEGRERREESISRGSGAAELRTVFISDPVANVSYSLDPARRIAHKMPSANRVMFSPSAGGGVATGPQGGAIAMPRSAAPAAATVHSIDHATETLTIHATTATPMPAGTAGVMVGGVAMAGGGGRGGGGMISSSRGPAPKVEQLGKQMFDGVEAEGTRTTITIPAGQDGNERPIEIVSERWYSKELQVAVMTKHNDPRSGERIYKLNSITRNEPLRSLFEVPPDYTEPEQMRVRQLKQEEL